MSSSFVWVDSTSWELPFFGLPSRIPWPADADPKKASEEPFDHETLVNTIESMGDEAGEPWKSYLAASEHFDGVAELLEDGECPEATTLLDEIEALLPGTAFVAFHRGTVAQQEGRYADAIEHFEAAANKTPNMPAIWLQLGMLQAQEGNRDKAIAALNQAAKLNPRDKTPFEALASLKAAVKALRDPNDPNSVTYLSIPQYKQVCEKQLGELQNNPAGLVEFGEFQIHHKFAPEFGVRALERARQLAPSDLRTLAALSGGYSATDAHDQAKAVAEQITTLAPDDPRAWVNLAQIRAAAGDTEGELTALQRTLELDPNAPPALAKIFDIAKGPNPEGERRMVEHATEKKATVAMLLASDAAHGRGDETTALDYASRAFTLEPEREEVLLQYCAMISANKDEARLRRDIEPALHSGKYSKRLDWNFAHALKAIGHTQEAVNALITAASAEGAPEDFQHTVSTTIDLWTQRLAQSEVSLDRNSLGGLSRPVLLSLDGEDGAVLMRAGQTLPAENRFPWRVRLDGNGETVINLQQGQTGGALDPIKLGAFAVKTPPVTGGAHTIQCLLGAGPDGKLLFKAVQGNRELPVRWVAPRPGH
jgi:tetratricopeptide (TPR) repeat protein